MVHQVEPLGALAGGEGRGRGRGRANPVRSLGLEIDVEAEDAGHRVAGLADRSMAWPQAFLRPFEFKPATPQPTLTTALHRYRRRSSEQEAHEPRGKSAFSLKVGLRSSSLAQTPSHTSRARGKSTNASCKAALKPTLPSPELIPMLRYTEKEVE